jgi:archaeosine-15-forming tRNA-guanine transglycosylase
LTEVNGYDRVNEVDKSQGKEVDIEMSDEAGEIKWVPVATVVRMLKVTKQRVHDLMAEGRIRSVTMDGTRLVSLRSLNEYLTLRGKGGVGNGTDRRGI